MKSIVRLVFVFILVIVVDSGVLLNINMCGGVFLGGVGVDYSSGVVCC